MADHPFILEFPIREASLPPVTNHRRIREHRRLTLLLNLLLVGTTRFLPDRRRHYWANVRPDGEPEIKWVQEHYFAKMGEPTASELSSPTGDKLVEVASNEYYTAPSFNELGLLVPDDLDKSICRYRSLSPALREKFDRATYWMSMASRQWEDSMSVSFASLVLSVEALTDKGTRHYVHCEECKKKVPHDVPGATENFRAFFERYAPEPDLEKRRGEMYKMRSGIEPYGIGQSDTPPVAALRSGSRAVRLDGRTLASHHRAAATQTPNRSSIQEHGGGIWCSIGTHPPSWGI
jgi:hypothetical protein